MKSNNNLSDGGGKALVFAMTEDIPDVVNDLTTGGNDKTLSAEQGKALKAEIDYIRRCVAVRESKTVTEIGWYRIAVGQKSEYLSCILSLGQWWENTTTGGKIVIGTFSRENSNVSVYNRVGQTTLVNKIRHVYSTTHTVIESYIDIYIRPNISDTIFYGASTIIGLEFYKPEDVTLAEIPQGYAATEYDIT